MCLCIRNICLFGIKYQHLNSPFHTVLSRHNLRTSLTKVSLHVRAHLLQCALYSYWGFKIAIYHCLWPLNTFYANIFPHILFSHVTNMFPYTTEALLTVHASWFCSLTWFSDLYLDHIYIYSMHTKTNKSSLLYRSNVHILTLKNPSFNCTFHWFNGLYFK